ncbi:hypothetical protein [Candidatus Phyllobacterium onerii]|uniref:hypothetical protein n=1 Tax=Candidatus Phyllobacterium onerii TaxID=3020828 RepID=UPI00232BA335|nr:hypothetical protein [Phyllobacterium sp. IY22]
MTLQRETFELFAYAGIGIAIAVLPLFLVLAFLIQQPSMRRYSYEPSTWSTATLGFAMAGALFFLTCIQATPARIACVVALAVPFLLLLLVPGERHRSVLCAAILAAFTAIAFVLNFSSGPYEPDPTNTTGIKFFESGWYHWSAYLAPAKSLGAGLVIYRDFPSQYGLVPPLLMAAASKMGWVAGTFYVFGVLQFLFWLSLTCTALVVVRRARDYNPLIWLAALSTVLATCFFWAGGPSFANITPSLGGIRYFPVAVLAAAIVLKSPSWLLHILWAIGALWSIESLFMVSFVWWPQCILINLPRGGTPSAILWSFIRSALVLIGVALATLVMALALYLALYGVLPDPNMLFSFGINPPGALQSTQLVQFSSLSYH